MDTTDQFIGDVANFLHNKGYRQIEVLGKGGFGSVLSATLSNDDAVAIKIIKNENCWDLEERIWPRLRNKNILPLLEMIEVESLNVKLFVMPKQPCVLHKVLTSESFLSDKKGLKRIKHWMIDILNGLDYLHSTGYAHLDLKKDNILISADDIALICDFSGLSVVNIPLKRLCSPKVFRPPECYDVSLYKNAEGATFDVWLFGLMSLNILTGNWPSSKMGHVKNSMDWKVNVEPFLMVALHQPAFCTLMKTSFPSVCITEEELVTAHGFVSSIMQWDPSKRPTVQEILSHRFLADLENGNNFHEATSKAKEEILCDTKAKYGSYCTEVKITSSDEDKVLPNDKYEKTFSNEELVEVIDSFFYAKVIYEPSRVEMPKTSSNEKAAVINDDHIQHFVNEEFSQEDNFLFEKVNNEISALEASQAASSANMPVSYNDKHRQFEDKEIVEEKGKLPKTENLLKDLINNNQHLDFVEELPKKRKNLSRRIKGWFAKKWNRIFK